MPILLETRSRRLTGLATLQPPPLGISRANPDRRWTLRGVAHPHPLPEQPCENPNKRKGRGWMTRLQEKNPDAPDIAQVLNPRT